MAADIATIMTGIGTALDGITGVRGYAFPPKSAQPPFAFPDMPERIEFDCSMQRGCDRATINVVVAVADVVDRAATAKLLGYMAGSGSLSVKDVLDGAVGQSCRVVSCEPRAVVLAGTTYMGAVFTLDVVY